MTKYRKKPVEIRAWKLQGEVSDVPTWIEYFDSSHVNIEIDEGGEVLWIDIKTPEGVLTALPGDWVIQGVKGDIYPCKPDIFEITYEEVK